MCVCRHVCPCVCVCVCVHACARECVELLLGDRGVWAGEVAQLGLLFKEIVMGCLKALESQRPHFLMLHPIQALMSLSILIHETGQQFYLTLRFTMRVKM